jgi:integrase/recombinase XerD
VDVRNRAIFEMLFSTGIRVGELCGLIYENVDVASGTIKIIGKGDKERLVPVCNKEILDCLNDYICLRNKINSFQSHFFLTRTGKPMQEQNVRLIVHQYAEKSELSSTITPHMFRHSLATYLLEQGVDIRYIQVLLGHSNITTTQIYTTVNEKKQRELLEQFHPRNSFI